MYLLFDLSEKTQLRICVFDEEKAEWHEKEGLNRDLLSFVDDVLQKEGKKPEAVQGIATVLGVGSFTSTRIGTTVANGFALIHKIPLVAATMEDVLDPQRLSSRFTEATPGQYLSATYSGEANIGRKKD